MESSNLLVHRLINPMTTSVFKRAKEVNLEEVKVIVLRLNLVNGRLIIGVYNASSDSPNFIANGNVAVILLVSGLD